MLICPPVNTKNQLRSKLQKAAAPIYREYDQLQVRQARNRLERRRYCLPCFGHVVFYKNMRVRKVTLVSSLKPKPRTSTPAFMCDLDVLGPRSLWGPDKLGGLPRHVSHAEAEARAACGNCELVRLSDSVLEQLWETLDNVDQLFDRQDVMSLQFLYAAAALELQARAEESAHARLKRVAAYEAFAEDNDEAMRAEREKAKKWFDDQGAVYIRPEYTFLAHEDQVVLAYRRRVF